ncbi:MAG: hypothetical protein V4679_18055 [Pseudomonadota bacterium]
MKHLFQQLAIAALALLLVAAAGICALSLLFPDLCGNRVLAETVSPDQRHKAVVFQRDCGAATGFSTQVSLMAAKDALPDESGNVFTADSNHGAVPTSAAGGPVVQVRWASGRDVVITHHAGARVFTHKHSVSGVAVAYEQVTAR